MKLTPPKAPTFWISIVLVLVGLLSHLGIFTALASFAFWLVFIGFVLLLAGLLLKGF